MVEYHVWYFDEYVNKFDMVVYVSEKNTISYN